MSMYAIIPVDAIVGTEVFVKRCAAMAEAERMVYEDPTKSVYVVLLDALTRMELRTVVVNPETMNVWGV